ncbi:MAG: haloacid dehalogenase [Neobacillus sp.]|nr:haloacid dehalogenase [Neobacillus sp.]
MNREEVLNWLKVDSKTAFKHYGISEEQREEYHNYHINYAKRNSVPFENVEDVLSSVDSNIIVTHRDKESTTFLLEKFDLRKYFKDIVAVEEQGFTRKPHISSYEYVLKSHNIDLVVGDRDLDLIPARALNIKTVAFKNRSIEADFHIDNYADFFPMVVKALKEM